MEHESHGMKTRTLVIELRRRAIRDGSPVVTWMAG